MLQRCITCLYPVTKPDLHFDAETGECSACRNSRAKDAIDWKARADEFSRIIDHLPRNDSGYDVIVASSGGKDSYAQVHRALALGLRPLIVTAQTCMLSNVGRRNIENLKNYATTIEVAASMDVRATLNRLAMRNCGDISWPEHAAIFSTPFRIAAAHGIPVILYGESPQFEYGGPPGAEEAKAMTSKWVSEFGGFLGWRPRDFVGMDGILPEHMRDYELPSPEKLAGVTALFLGQYYRWNSRENAETAIGMGMRVKMPHAASWWGFENMDNGQTAIHDHQMWRKYGYGRVTAQLGVDLRNKSIPRDNAIRVMNRYDGVLPCISNGIELDDVIRHIGMSREQFIAALDDHTNWELFERRKDNDPMLSDDPFNRIVLKKENRLEVEPLEGEG